MTDTIVKNDVSADIDADAETTAPAEDTRPPLERDRRMAEIARQVEEAAGIVREEVPAALEPVAPVVAAPVKTEADRLTELGYYNNAKGELVTKININGTEREVLASQVKLHLQKDLAGDAKLKNAADREQRLQQQEEQLRLRENQLKQTLTTQPKPPVLGVEEARKQAKAVLEKLWEGDTDTAANNLAELLQRGNTTVDTAKIVAEAEQRTLSTIEKREQAKQAASWEASAQEGNRHLAEKHPEIYRDQRLFDLVNQETERMVARQRSGDPDFAELTPKDIIVKAADAVQSWMGRDKPPPVDPPAAVRPDAKRTLRPVPKTLGKVAAREAKPVIDMSPTAVIARMRQSRAV